MFNWIESVVSSQGFWLGVGFGQGPLIFILLIILIDHFIERRKKIERQEKEKKEEEKNKRLRSTQLGEMLSDTSLAFVRFIGQLKTLYPNIFFGIERSGKLNVSALFQLFHEDVAWGVVELILHNAVNKHNPFHKPFTSDVGAYVYSEVAARLYDLFGGDEARAKVKRATWKRGEVKRRLLLAIDAEIVRHIP